MTIDEAIAHAEWCAENSCGECAEEHRQLSEWLKELRERKSTDGVLEDERNLLAQRLGDYREALEDARAENARLRKLLQGAVNEMLDDCGDCWGGLSEYCECWVAEWKKELRALGIEVDDD